MFIIVEQLIITEHTNEGLTVGAAALRESQQVGEPDGRLLLIDGREESFDEEEMYRQLNMLRTRTLVSRKGLPAT